jgi:hypothetical protein
VLSFISSRGFSPVGGLYPIYMYVSPFLHGHFRRLLFYQFFVRGQFFLSMDMDIVVTFESFKAMKP